MLNEAFLKRVLMFIGVILSGLITLIFIAEPAPFRVDVPDDLPLLTTRSSQLREMDEAKKFFEADIGTVIPGAELAAVISWSPNGKYILADVRLKNSGTTQAYVLDLSRRLYVLVPGASWIDSASWAGTRFAFRTEGHGGLFDVGSGESFVFGEGAGEHTPVISSDASRVAYSDNGLVVYSTKAKTSTRLTDNKNDIPALWGDDVKSFYFFRTIVTQGGEQNSLQSISIGTKKETLITLVPGFPKTAEWIKRDHRALFDLGHDENTIYFADFDTNLLLPVTEVTEGTAIVVHNDRNLAILRETDLELYDFHMSLVDKAVRSGMKKILSAGLLPSNNLFYIRDKSRTSAEAVLYDMSKKTEYKLAETWLPYAVLSPNGFSAATVALNNTGVHFIDIPPEEAAYVRK